MTPETAVQRFERKITEGPKAAVIEAAYGPDIIWINMANIYGFSDAEQAPLRNYIRKTYRANGVLIVRQ